MATKSASTMEVPDPAAIFACALSLWQASQKLAANRGLDLSESYNGIDEFMRVVMRIGNQFEVWACVHVRFDEVDEVWPYLLDEKFGDACLSVFHPTALAEFNDADCLRAALQLRLPVIADDKLPVPIDISAVNPVTGSFFKTLRVQTVRNSLEDNEVVPFVAGDEPSDENFGEIYFGLYGIDEAGKLEHIADRKHYGEAISLAQKLAPGIAFPLSPTVFFSRSSS